MDSINFTNLNSVVGDTINNLSIRQSDSLITVHYLDILERTNSQLSLWYNPYGVMIGIVTVLFAILAIAVAIALYRQSKEFRDILKTSITEHNDKLRELGNAASEVVKRQELEFVKVKESFQQEINHLKTTVSKGDESGEIEKKINELQTRLNEMTSIKDKEIVDVTTASSSSVFILRDKIKQVVCPHCGNVFIARKQNDLFTVTTFGGPFQVQCPKCTGLFPVDFMFA